MAKEERLTPDSAVKTESAPKKAKKKTSFFKAIGNWFRGMKSELKKVVWPTPKQLVNNTLVALVVMVVCAIVIWGFDTLAGNGIKALIALIG